MFLRADLGLVLCSLLSVAVGWFVVRRKWRRAAMRRQEIRRLLALASEETARAEFEAAALYSRYEEESPVFVAGTSPQRQLQYQCEVCFRPTTTRCKRCKAVHYCSGKCQIVHWRQGHKDECESLSSHQNINGGLHQKDDIQSGGDGNRIEKRFPTKTVVTSSGERSSNEHSQWNKLSTSTNDDEMKPVLSEQSVLVNPVVDVSAFDSSNKLKSGCVDTDVLSETSTSSCCRASGHEKNSLSEASNSSSDFWEATTEPIKSKIDTLDEFRDASMQNYCSPSSGGSNKHVKVLDFCRSTIKADDPHSISVSKNSTDETLSTEKGNPDGFKSRGSVLTSHPVSGHTNANETSRKRILKIEECESSSSALLEEKVSEIKVTPSDKDAPEVNSLHYLMPKSLKTEIDHRSVSLDTVECQQSDSPTFKTSETRLSGTSSTRKHDVLDVQSEKAGGTQIYAHFSTNIDHAQNTKNGNSAPTRRVVEQLRSSNFTRNCYLGSRIGNMGKYKGSFPYEHFVQLYNWNKVELRPCGLINCGNSCYANAVLQCLVFTPPLTAYFLQGLHSKTCGKNDSCFTCEFEALVKKLKEGKSPLSPVPVLSQMGRLGSHLGNGREEDAHEFLRYVIDAMQFVHEETGFKTHCSLDEDTTLVGLTFGGYLRSKIDCMRCGSKSEQHERIMDLTVEIGGGISSLEEALQQFTRSEILDGDNKYYCDRCKSYEKAKKKLKLLEAPNILTIALKRFQSGQYGKLNKTVKFPEFLNLAFYMSGTSDKSPIYQLYGVVVHLDAMNATFSGHYVCYIKNNLGRWFKADDSTVREVDIQEVLLAGAYMLLYARCSPRFPRLRTSVTPPETRKVKNELYKSNSRPRELSRQICNDCFYLHCQRFHHSGENLENDIVSENSSSIFSDAGSHSTENSNRESSSTDDSLDQILGDNGSIWNRPWRNSSDSDTSSPSSLYMRHSPLSDLDRYSSDPETSDSCVFCASSKVGRNDFQASKSEQVTNLTNERRNPSLSVVDRGSTNTMACEENSYRIGCDNPRKNIHLRRSIR